MRSFDYLSLETFSNFELLREVRKRNLTTKLTSTGSIDDILLKYAKEDVKDIFYYHTKELVHDIGMLLLDNKIILQTIKEDVARMCTDIKLEVLTIHPRHWSANYEQD